MKKRYRVTFEVEADGWENIPIAPILKRTTNTMGMALPCLIVPASAEIVEVR
jgi:hypothetical protein